AHVGRIDLPRLDFGGDVADFVDRPGQCPRGLADALLLLFGGQHQQNLRVTRMMSSPSSSALPITAHGSSDGGAGLGSAALTRSSASLRSCSWRSSSATP